MKANTLPLIIALALAALIGYAFYAASHSALYCVASTLSSLVTLGGAMGFSYGGGRTNANIRVLSGSAFLLLLVVLILAALTHWGPAATIVTSGIILLLYLLVSYLINKANQ